MVVRSIDELERALRKEMQKAMRVVSEKALADMYEETGGFYTGGEPKVYERTGALGDTPRVTPPTVGGDSVSFKAYLDTSGGYTTGKQPSMETVLTLANTGSYPGMRSTVGRTHFWDRAKDKINDDFLSTMSSFGFK